MHNTILQIFYLIQGRVLNDLIAALLLVLETFSLTREQEFSLTLRSIMPMESFE